VFTTGRCNLNCKYCGGSFPEFKVPSRPRYSLESLKRFMKGDEEPIIAFYGGEPLINPSFIQEVMDEKPDAKFVIQTNATLIDALPAKYWRKMDTVLVSIDGRREVTDGYRGHGVYEAVVQGAKKLREQGFRGDLIARMTLSEKSDVYLDVIHLLSLEIFDHVHWQLDVIWSPRWLHFNAWAKQYIEGLRMLMDCWLDALRKGKVLGIVPFLGVLKTLLTGKPIEVPPCGAGSTAVAISTDGRVLACPIAVEEDWAYLGKLEETTWRSVRGKVTIGEPCSSCRYFHLCGGRCLYSHIERLWGMGGFRAVCRLTLGLIKPLTKIKQEVTNLVRKGMVSLSELLYPPYNNTTEIIP